MVANPNTNMERLKIDYYISDTVDDVWPVELRFKSRQDQQDFLNWMCLPENLEKKENDAE